jgi:hypothetical protein
MGVGPGGQAVIVWQVTRNPILGGTYNAIVYRQADGHLDRPVRFGTERPGARAHTRSHPDQDRAKPTRPLTVRIHWPSVSERVPTGTSGPSSVGVGPVVTLVVKSDGAVAWIAQA